MISFSDLLTVQGNILFAGGNTGQGSALCPAAGCITDGTIDANGDFTQDGTNSSQSFHARDFNTVRFVGTAAQSLSFTNPADGPNSHFANVRFENIIGVTLATDIYAHCDLISFGLSAANIIGNGNKLTVGGLLVNDLKLDGVLLVYDGIPDTHSTGFFSGFSNVTFSNYVATDVQFTVIDNGAIALGFSNVQFLTTPTPGVGYWVRAVDADNAVPLLTINFDISSSSDCGGVLTDAQNGAVVIWNNC